MGSVIAFFRWVFEGLAKLFEWIVGVPGLLITSITTIYYAINNLIVDLSVGGGPVSSVVSRLEGPVDNLASFVEGLPDIARLGIYCLSLDVAFDMVVSVFTGFFALALAVFVFFAITVPAFYLRWIMVKWSAWILTAMFPKGFQIAGLSSLANLNFRASVRHTLQDGKFNFFLGG